MHILVFPSRQSLCEIPLMNLSRDGLCRYIARKIRRPIVLCSHSNVLASRITHLPRQGHTSYSRTLHCKECGFAPLHALATPPRYEPISRLSHNAFLLQLFNYFLLYEKRRYKYSWDAVTRTRTNRAKICYASHYTTSQYHFAYCKDKNYFSEYQILLTPSIISSKHLP